MNISEQIAKHIRDLHFGGNATGSCLKEHLADVTWEEANRKIHNLNTIGELTFHINYYVGGVIPALKGGSLDIRDKYSYDHPPILSATDWEKMLEKTWADAEEYASLAEAIPEDQLMGNFLDGKYGNNFRNIVGLIEHSYYHLGQIVLIKKILRGGEGKM